MRAAVVRAPSGVVVVFDANRSARLKGATDEQLLNYRFIGRHDENEYGAEGVHWPDVDEDLRFQTLAKWRIL